MQRTIRTLILGLVAALLAACTSAPVSLTFGDAKNPERVTAVTGLKSHDAANVMGYAAYTGAQVKKPQKAVCSLKAAAGQTLNISGLAEFTCWAPETDTMARPVQADGELMQAAKALREGIGGTLKDATPVILGGMALSDRKSARSSAERVAAEENETERARLAAQTAQTDRLLGAVESANERAAAAEAAAAAAAAVLPVTP